jgi:hypothetical protein
MLRGWPPERRLGPAKLPLLALARPLPPATALLLVKQRATPRPDCPEQPARRPDSWVVGSPEWVLVVAGRP